MDSAVMISVSTVAWRASRVLRQSRRAFLCYRQAMPKQSHTTSIHRSRCNSRIMTRRFRTKFTTNSVRQSVPIMLPSGMCYDCSTISLRVSPLRAASSGRPRLEIAVDGVVVLVGSVAIVKAYRALVHRHPITRTASLSSSTARAILITMA